MKYLSALTCLACLSAGAVQGDEKRIYHIGESGIRAPIVIQHGDPEFPNKACEAGRDAAYRTNSTNISLVVLSLVVGSNGRAQDMKVTRRVGLDLDAQAVEVLRTFRFKPAIMRDGTAVPVYGTIEVHFHLPEKCFPNSKSTENSK